MRYRECPQCRELTAAPCAECRRCPLCCPAKVCPGCRGTMCSRRASCPTCARRAERAGTVAGAAYCCIAECPEPMAHPGPMCRRHVADAAIGTLNAEDVLRAVERGWKGLR